LPEWLYEAGIGEARAALVDDDQIIEAAIELDSDALKVGMLARARLVELLPGRRGRVALDGGEASINHLPPGITQGASLTVEIVREALPEAGRAKLAKAVPSDLPPCPAPTLYERLMATGLPVRSPRAHEPDALEAAGWSELLDEATSGEIVFPLGALRLSPTPAMTTRSPSPPRMPWRARFSDTGSAARSASISRPSPARRNATRSLPRSTNRSCNHSSALR
jgi:ribonuclease G